MRHTKIVATLGPACESDRMLDELVAAGVDIFRLNFSHGSHESHADLCRRVRKAAARAGRLVAVLQDLSGPKIRTGRLEKGGPLDLPDGATVRIATGDFLGTAARISTTYAGLARSVRPGDRLLLDDGRIELRVAESDGSEIVTTVVDGGTLGEHKGINAPGVALGASSVTDKDVDDLRAGLELGVDMVALSFVRTAADLVRTREIMTAAGGGDVPLIAKLERPEALDHLDDILGACDGVMVARGDLGLELPLERVPRAQREITRHARAHAVPVIVATQVLESMRTEPRPTRAEVSDASSAVESGVDAIMLAGETAIGAFPARAVHTLDAIIREAERGPWQVGPVATHLTGTGPAQALCEAAITLASRADAAAIVAVTRGGNTARMLSALRPEAPIYAATDREEMARRLTLLWGVVPLVTAIGEDVDAAGVLIGQELRARGLLPAAAAVVLVSVSPDLTRTNANFLKLQKLI